MLLSTVGGWVNRRPVVPEGSPSVRTLDERISGLLARLEMH